MARRSPVSNQASNGSASGSVYESDSTLGTLQNDEDWDEYLLAQDGQPTQATRAFHENQSLQDTQVYGAGQSSPEHARADKNYLDASKRRLPRSLKRFLKESDPREKFRVGVQVPGETGQAERDGSITLSEYRSPNEVGRSNTVKKPRKSSTKEKRDADGMGSNEAESINGLSPMKSRKRGRTGPGK